MTTSLTTGESGSSLDKITTPLILDLLDWLAPGPRPYAEVMETWRTSCPRLTIWEDAVDNGLVERRYDADAGRSLVTLTISGRRMLEARGRRG